MTAALDKEVTMYVPPSGRTTGLEVMKSVPDMINAHIVAEVEFFKETLAVVRVDSLYSI